jgi:hypothetical protein
MPRKEMAKGPMTERFNLMQFTDSLIKDLELLRTGKISLRDASVRADLAKQVLRAVGLVVTAQKYIEGSVTKLPSEKSP